MDYEKWLQEDLRTKKEIADKMREAGMIGLDNDAFINGYLAAREDIRESELTDEELNAEYSSLWNWE